MRSFRFGLFAVGDLNPSLNSLELSRLAARENYSPPYIKAEYGFQQVVN